MEDAGIYVIESSFLGRYVEVGVASGRVISVSFPQQPSDDASDSHPVLDRIAEYLDGVSPVEFDDVQVALTVPTTQRAVLEQVRGLTYGTQVDVAGLAGMTPDLDADDENDLIQVRTALDENPAPLLVPDHRVRDGPSAAPPTVEQKLRSLEGL